MILVFGTRTIRWGSAQTDYVRTCPHCGYFGHFIRKKQIRTIALFFVIPLLPISGITHADDCPRCRTQFAQS